MAKKIKIKLQDGTEQEVDLPEGYLSPEEVAEHYMPKSTFRVELNRRLKGKMTADEFLANDELKQKALQAWGISVDDSGKAKLTADQLAAAKKQWELAELAPINEKLTKTSERLTKTQAKILEASILRAAAGRVHESLLKPPAAGAKIPFMAMLESAFGFNDELDDYFVKGTDGFEFAPSKKPENGRPYKGVDEFVDEWVANEANKPFVVSTRQGGAGLNGEGHGRTGANITISKADATDAQKYRTAQKQAAEQGGRVIVADA